ncbi:MAG: hypothetical protein CVU00_06550 [Bacteroidetes bacterium HGW-Bacteroidetes-17]|nr:MAG: hypothetical protein CVU00_06550 [Bacteroidetes bacterium HGW-Bacteroidetes-17]
MPTYAFLVLFSIKAYFSLIIPMEGKIRILLLIFIVTFIFPVMVILFFRSTNVIKSLYQLGRQERKFPYITTIAFYLMAYYLLKNVQISPIFHYFTFGATVLSMAVFAINFFWKISAHMIAIGGLTGMLLGLAFTGIVGNPYLVVIAVFIAGIVGFARLQLNANTHAQVYSGFLLGVFGMLYLSLYF